MLWRELIHQYRLCIPAQQISQCLAIMSAETCVKRKNSLNFSKSQQRMELTLFCIFLKLLYTVCRIQLKVQTKIYKTNHNDIVSLKQKVQSLPETTGHRSFTQIREKRTFLGTIFNCSLKNSLCYSECVFAFSIS